MTAKGWVVLGKSGRAATAEVAAEEAGDVTEVVFYPMEGDARRVAEAAHARYAAAELTWGPPVNRRHPRTRR